MSEVKDLVALAQRARVAHLAFSRAYEAHTKMQEAHNKRIGPLVDRLSQTMQESRKANDAFEEAMIEEYWRTDKQHPFPGVSVVLRPFVRVDEAVLDAALANGATP